VVPVLPQQVRYHCATPRRFLISAGSPASPVVSLKCSYCVQAIWGEIRPERYHGIGVASSPCQYPVARVSPIAAPPMVAAIVADIVAREEREEAYRRWRKEAFRAAEQHPLKVALVDPPRRYPSHRLSKLRDPNDSHSVGSGGLHGRPTERVRTLVRRQ
jgi:hypothetical protein